ncbi:hypothetical protein HOLleu_20021 [Holothuria leucospilota]|uniref:Uncharacterized protein n=1 Tax=Holothuria leucospilota TaxID=206669 RepID=A0A9Q1BZ85_HOLLE|nr:hypothetical protein HOLleu_20021 [Holothuria leucospilota]
MVLVGNALSGLDLFCLIVSSVCMLKDVFRIGLILRVVYLKGVFWAQPCFRLTNDLPDVISGCRVKIFADDTKLYKEIGSQKDCELLYCN